MNQKRNVLFSLPLGALGVAFSFSVFAKGDADQYWPQWRGPLQTGVAPAAEPPTTWSESANVKWKVKIPGDGNATPIIWGSQIFIQTAIPAGKKADTSSTQASSALALASTRS